jgi:hypothetical protein
MLDVYYRALDRANQKFDLGSMKKNYIADVGHELWDVIFCRERELSTHRIAIFQERREEK